jgi:hypothetical protein
VLHLVLEIVNEKATLNYIFIILILTIKINILNLYQATKKALGLPEFAQYKKFPTKHTNVLFTNNYLVQMHTLSHPPSQTHDSANRQRATAQKNRRKNPPGGQYTLETSHP